LGIENYCSKIEKLMLRSDATAPEIHRAATEAMRSNFAAIVVAPVWVARVAAMLRGSGVSVGTVIGFPLGMNKATIKAIEATSSIKDGAAEIEIVPFLPNMLSGDVDALRAELLEINRAARTTSREVVIKVCIEAPRMKDAPGATVDVLLERATKAIRESGGDCVSLSTDVFSQTAEMIPRVRQFAQGLTICAIAADASETEIAKLIVAGADRVGV
jgi:deoxyribose-phosphate aldolase